MMPIHERVEFSFRAALASFVGYAVGFAISIFIAEAIYPSSGGEGKFSMSALVVIFSLLICVLGAIHAMGSMIVMALLAVVVVDRRLWFLAGLLGLVCAVIIFALTFYLDVVLLEFASFIAIFLMGGVSALLLRPIGLLMGWARPWYPAGHCQACGYDLLYTPKDSTCPECGTPVSGS